MLRDAYAAVARGEDGTDALIGTCAVAAGAAAFAVSCGKPGARVVRIPEDVADRAATLILENIVELGAAETDALRTICKRLHVQPVGSSA